VRTSNEKPAIQPGPRQYTGLSMRRLRQIATSVLFLGLALHAGVQKRQQYYLKPDQTADLSDTKLVTAKQSCENWGLAAGLQTMLARQNVALDQSFWVMRLNYGEICVERVPSMELLAKVVNQMFVLDDGRHVRLELHFTPGAPVNVDDVLAGLKRDQPSLLLWRGHPYYLVGATYDERIGRDGTRFFELKELRLTDTFAKQPATTFQKGRDKPEEIDGIVSVSVVPL
jgi:hypothetical protein